MSDSSPPKLRPKILVVDDDAIFLATASACLTKAGFSVHTASDGVEALEYLSSRRPEVLLIDLVMPRIDGFRLIGLIRGAPWARNTAIMVITSRTDKQAVDEARGLGVQAFLTKPIDWNGLGDRVRALLTERASNEAQ